MDAETERDFNWAKQFEDEAHIKLMRALLPFLLRATSSSQVDDMRRAIDAHITTVPFDDIPVAMRLRREQKKRDFTIRSRRGSNAQTEIDKLWDNGALIYFYGWTVADKFIKDYLIVRINETLRSLFRDAPDIPNRDGKTWFRPMSIRTLDKHGLVITSCGIPRATEFLIKPQDPLRTPDAELVRSTLSDLRRLPSDFHGQPLKIGPATIVNPGLYIAKLIEELESPSTPLLCVWSALKHAKAFIDRVQGLTHGS